MNPLCVLFNHKHSWTADTKYRGAGYNRYEFNCQRRGCKSKISIKEKADDYGFPLSWTK